MGSEVRLAVPQEAAEITRVHIAAWRDAYRGILPSSHLEGLDEEMLTRRREGTLRASQLATFVAVREGRIAGYCVAGPNRGSPPTVGGELQAIYLLPGDQGVGLGRQLTCAAAEWLLHHLGESMVVWTFEQNTPARGFYQHLGGVLAGYRFLSIESAGTFPVVAYRWDDVRVLLASKS
jgi:ribosomal protein S18 acetylase RimI-like enzyme